MNSNLKPFAKLRARRARPRPNLRGTTLVVFDGSLSLRVLLPPPIFFSHVSLSNPTVK